MQTTQVAERLDVATNKVEPGEGTAAGWRTWRQAWRLLTEQPCAAAWLVFASAPLNGPHGR